MSFSRNACPYDPEGHFEIADVPPGSYVLSARFGHRNRTFSTRVPVEVGDSDVEGVEVAVVPDTKIKGLVRFEGMAPFPLSELNISLAPRDQPEVSIGWAVVKTDGSFELENVAEDDYRVWVHGGSKSFYLKSLSLGNWGSDDGTFSLTRDRSRDTLDVMLSTAAGSIEGTTVDDGEKPFAGAYVVLIPRFHSSAGPHQAINTGTDGQFSFSRIAPGDYKLFAWPSMEGVE